MTGTPIFAYDGLTVNRKRIALYAVPIFILVLALISLVAFVSETPLLAFFGFFIFIIPFFFLNQIRRRFAKKIHLDLYKDSFSMTTFNLRSGDQEKDANYNWNEIEAARITFPIAEYTALKLYLKTGVILDLTFWLQGQKSNKSAGNDIGKILVETISSYNNEAERNDAITFKPAFFATRGGLFFIYGLSVLFLVAIVLHLIYNTKPLPITLILGVGSFAQILVRRKKDIELYKKLNATPSIT